MDESVETVLAEYEQRGREENAILSRLSLEEIGKRRDEFLLAVGRSTGSLLNILVKEAVARTILEIGTSYGYSTLWLAEAARETGGKVITLEIHPRKQEHARAAAARAGLERFVDFRLGDALELLAKLEERADFVLLDLWKDLYVPCFDLFYPRLKHGALIVADNMIHPESARQAAEAYRKRVRSRADIESVLLPVGSGLEVSRYCGT